MDICLCSAIRSLAKDYDEDQARSLIPALNTHLKDIRALLAQSKSLTRDVQYCITLNNQRIMKALSVESVKLKPVDQLYNTFNDDVAGFWTSSVNTIHSELRRRLACVVIFLRSKLDAGLVVPPQIARIFQGQTNYADLRHFGRKYIKIARKLGGLGAILWLPLDIPHSTYERYLNIDDEEVFDHLSSLGPGARRYGDFVPRLVLNQLHEPPLSRSYYNLLVEYGDCLPYSENSSLLLYALGGSNVPDVLFKSVQTPQRRWNSAGEIEHISAVEFGFPIELSNLMEGETGLIQSGADSYIKYINERVLNDTLIWSLRPEIISFLGSVLLPDTLEKLRGWALMLICFACPPCYEGNQSWSPSLKKLVWPLLETILKAGKVPASLQQQALEATLFFCERDSVAVRRSAVEQARMLLRKSMPYYLHASVVLFESILSRLDGELVKSVGLICAFQGGGLKPDTRLDHALQGRLHISQIENKIKCYDTDVPTFIYNWEAKKPLSSLDIEVVFRLQSSAARFFQSVGDFRTARASLEPVLSLPIRDGTRQVIIGRLADVYCEMQDFSLALDILRPEFDRTDRSEYLRRPFRRLLLAFVEANIGMDFLEVADLTVKELENAMAVEPEDLHDQQLHMRRLLAAARIPHMRQKYAIAVHRWKYALEEVERMHTLKSRGGFIAAMIYMSLAHAQLFSGDEDGGHTSWLAGAKILDTERCEYWIPIVPTLWLQKVVTEIRTLQGWTFRMMLPSGNSDLTRP